MVNVRNRVRIGIVGLGRVATTTHIPVLKQLKDVEISACAETNRERIERVREFLSLPNIFSDYHEMFASHLVDAVYVCTPPHLHYDATVSALRNGIHVLCEKPMGRSLEEAIQMNSLAKEKNMVLMPGFKYRYSENIRQVASMVKSGLLGNILQMEGTFMTPGPYISWDPKSDWYLEKEQGGAIYDIGVHLIELINALFPIPIRKLCANATYGYCEYQTPTNVSCSFCMTDGSVGTMIFGWRTAADLVSVSIHGTAGSVSVSLKGYEYYNAGTDPKDRILSHARNAYFELRTVMKRIYSIFQGTEVSVNDLEQAKAFVRAIRGEEVPVVSSNDGVYVHRVLEGIRGSIQSGQYEEI